MVGWGMSIPQPTQRYTTQDVRRRALAFKQHWARSHAENSTRPYNLSWIFWSSQLVNTCSLFCFQFSILAKPRHTELYIIRMYVYIPVPVPSCRGGRGLVEVTVYRCLLGPALLLFVVSVQSSCCAAVEYISRPYTFPRSNNVVTLSRFERW